MLIKRKEIVLSQVSIFISIILIINFINLTLRHGTDLTHTSLMIFDTLSLTHQSNLTILFEHISQNPFAFLCEYHQNYIDLFFRCLWYVIAWSILRWGWGYGLLFRLAWGPVRCCYGLFSSILGRRLGVWRFGILVNAGLSWKALRCPFCICLRWSDPLLEEIVFGLGKDRSLKPMDLSLLSMIHLITLQQFSNIFIDSIMIDTILKDNFARRLLWTNWH